MPLVSTILLVFSNTNALKQHRQCYDFHWINSIFNFTHSCTYQQNATALLRIVLTVTCMLFNCFVYLVSADPDIGDIDGK